jgi:hypothetical protein
VVTLKEEREAWDRYMACLLVSDEATVKDSAERADLALKYRRDRFPLESGSAADATSAVFGVSVPGSKDDV